MTNLAIIIGILLIITGVAGYLVGMSDGRASMTALIPAVFGALIALFGVVGGMKESLRKHLMHAALLLALLGFIFPAWRIVSRLGDFSLSPAVIAQIVTAVLCLVFVLFGIRSFVDARRNG
jgi:hypothetical protein